MSAEEKDFFGRDQDIGALVALIDDPATTVLVVTGERGVGKTSLVSNILKLRLRFGPDPASRFARSSVHSPFPAGSAGLEDWLVASIARKVLPAIPASASRDELTHAIIAAAAKARIFLLIDNAEVLDQTWLHYFVGAWADTASPSLLVLTTTLDVPVDARHGAGHRTYRLNGFPADEAEAILRILGDDLAARFDRESLLAASLSLGGSPQRLRYLRWLSPSTEDELNRLVTELRDSDFAGGLIDGLRSRIARPLDHFLALGRARTLSPAESLLAWLWDKLGGGATASYVDVRDRLISEGVLTRSPGADAVVFRINPAIHIQLENHLARSIGRPHVSHVEYCLSEYYRDQFEGRDQEALKPDDMFVLREYLYHAFQARNIAAAVEFACSPSRLRQFHSLGLAMGLKPVFAELDANIALLLKQIDPELLKPAPTSSEAAQPSDDSPRRPIDDLGREQAELRRFQVPVKIELAHCAHDLSEHEACLGLLEEAERLLPSLGHPGDAAVQEAAQAIDYLRGTSFSDLGRSRESIGAYHALVRRGVDTGQVDERVILALGYLAFELRFHDVERALDLGRRALELAVKRGGTALVAKNQCSLAQTLVFSGHVDEAARIFSQAHAACGDGQTVRTHHRELGRVLVYTSVVHIANGNYEEALHMLTQGEHINRATGDRRRAATADALRAIVLWRMGGREAEAKALLDSALKRHEDMKDLRNLVNDVLSYAYFEGFVDLDHATAAAGEYSRRDQRWAQALATMRRSSGEVLNLFAGYWTKHVRPVLLG